MNKIANIFHFPGNKVPTDEKHVAQKDYPSRDLFIATTGALGGMTLGAAAAGVATPRETHLHLSVPLNSITPAGEKSLAETLGGALGTALKKIPK